MVSPLPKEEADNIYPLLVQCGMAIKVPHPSYPSTRISIQVPNLGIHISLYVYYALFAGFIHEIEYTGSWDMYDPEGYSLWFCDYKYNDENTVSFVTLNKVGGFLQRMDLARKYAFRKMLVIGSEPPFKVKGLWLFRGQEIPKFVLDECYDIELYEWRKVDISNKG
ncbi:elongation factor 1-gamma-like [Benincasa hispida]|uniref:elongation factor 1-gamma-like n=1 Tax=Benincasa hispida TaxID=102211 RepID=UPI001902279E|nr:elongation factor 1-gamma-like [Benincasa hispida]